LQSSRVATVERIVSRNRVPLTMKRGDFKAMNYGDRLSGQWVLVIVSIAFFLGFGLLVEFVPPTSQTNTICAFSLLESEVETDLGWTRLPALALLQCSNQRRVLDVLGNFPKDERAEVFDWTLDVTTIEGR
jgi:hypothetical protein